MSLPAPVSQDVTTLLATVGWLLLRLTAARRQQYKDAQAK